MKLNYYDTADNITGDNPGTFSYGAVSRDGHKFFMKKVVNTGTEDSFSDIPLRSGSDSNDGYLKNRLDYYKALAQCRNGNIMIVHDFFKYRSSYFAVSDYISRTPLLLDEIVSLDTENRLLLTKSILYSYAFLNFRHAVHFNVKTSNIMVVPSEKGFAAKIINFDFGFLENTEPHSLNGSTGYISPEHYLKLQGMPITLSCQSDVFSLGIVLHEMWTGEKPGIPGMRSTAGSLAEAVCRGSAPVLRKELPGLVRELIRDMLEPVAEKRITAARAHAILAKNANHVF